VESRKSLNGIKGKIISLPSEKHSANLLVCLVLKRTLVRELVSRVQKRQASKFAKCHYFAECFRAALGK
jgi:hypothetical protein